MSSPDDKYSWHFRPEQMVRSHLEQILAEVKSLRKEVAELKAAKKEAEEVKSNCKMGCNCSTCIVRHYHAQADAQADAEDGMRNAAGYNP